MPMVRCQECGGTVSDRLKKCPHCGNHMEIRSERYSQFYEKPKQYQYYQPEPHHVEEKEERPRRQTSSKGIALSVLSIALSLVSCTVSLIAIMVSGTSTAKEAVAQNIDEDYISGLIENYVQSVMADNETYDVKQTENNNLPKTNNEKNENHSSNGELDYIASDPIFYTNINSIGNTEYCFIQEIENTGDCPIYLKGCDLDIEDENGHLLATENFISNCPDVISPGETGYFYNSIGSTLLNESAQSAETIKPVSHVDIVKSKETPIEYEVSDTQLTKGTFDYPTVTGRVKNNTEEDDSLLYVNVIFYDNDNNVIAITGVNVQDLNSGSEKSFECTAVFTSGKLNYDDISNYKVVARKSYYQF